MKIFNAPPESWEQIHLIHETAYLPEYGWTGFDPSIGKRVGPGHIAVGVSHHPRGVMPVSGGFIGLSGIGTTLKVEISTKRLPPLNANDSPSNPPLGGLKMGP